MVWMGGDNGWAALSLFWFGNVATKAGARLSYSCLAARDPLPGPHAVGAGFLHPAPCDPKDPNPSTSNTPNRQTHREVIQEPT